MPSERPKQDRDYHRHKSYTLRPVDDEQRARWERRMLELGVKFSEWARGLLDRDSERKDEES